MSPFGKYGRFDCFIADGSTAIGPWLAVWLRLHNAIGRIRLMAQSSLYRFVGRFIQVWLWIGNIGRCRGGRWEVGSVDDVTDDWCGNVINFELMAPCLGFDSPFDGCWRAAPNWAGLTRLIFLDPPIWNWMALQSRIMIARFVFNSNHFKFDKIVQLPSSFHPISRQARRRLITLFCLRVSMFLQWIRFMSRPCWCWLSLMAILWDWCGTKQKKKEKKEGKGRKRKEKEGKGRKRKGKEGKGNKRKRNDGVPLESEEERSGRRMCWCLRVDAMAVIGRAALGPAVTRRCVTCWHHVTCSSRWRLCVAPDCALYSLRTGRTECSYRSW